MHILQSEIQVLQQRWADGILRISEAYFEGDDYRSIALDLVEDLYAYDEETVLFKPTLAVEEPFRLDKLSALSYFVGGNSLFNEDKGFALKPWTKIKFDNKGFIIKAEQALAMGQYYLTMENQSVQCFDYTFGFITTKKGEVKINLHHSSVRA